MALEPAHFAPLFGWHSSSSAVACPQPESTEASLFFHPLYCPGSVCFAAFFPALISRRASISRWSSSLSLVSISNITACAAALWCASLTSPESKSLDCPFFKRVELSDSCLLRFPQHKAPIRRRCAVSPDPPTCRSAGGRWWVPAVRLQVRMILRFSLPGVASAGLRHHRACLAAPSSPRQASPRSAPTASAASTEPHLPRATSPAAAGTSLTLAHARKPRQDTGPPRRTARPPWGRGLRTSPDTRDWSVRDR